MKLNYCPEHGDLLERPGDGADVRSYRCRDSHRIDEIRASFAVEELEWEALRAARAETWDEAIAAIHAWWSAPEAERPKVIVNPYGILPGEGK